MFLVVVFFVGMYSFQAIGAKQGEEEKARITSLTGQINDSGELITEDDQEVLLRGELGEELKQMWGQSVEVWGIMKKDNGYHTMDVNEYKVLEDMATDE